MASFALAVTGNENMEGFWCPDCRELSSITRETVNLLHNESMSIVQVEGRAGEDSGIRSHSIGETPEGGRSGGGYVVGNAWAGLVTDESGESFYRTISCRLSTEEKLLHPIFCAQMPDLAVAKKLSAWLQNTRGARGVLATTMGQDM